MRDDVFVGVALRAVLGVGIGAGVVGGMAGCQRDRVIDRVAEARPLAQYEEPLSNAAAVEGVKIEGMDGAFYRAGRLVVGAQPTEHDLRALRAGGVGTVINLRSNKEMGDREGVAFNEPAEVTSLGMGYVHIPLGGDDGYDPADVETFARALEACHGDALVHCASGARARAMWSAYLIRDRRWTREQAEELRRTLGERPGALERLLGEGG